MIESVGILAAGNSAKSKMLMMFSTRANSDKDVGARALTRGRVTRWLVVFGVAASLVSGATSRGQDSSSNAGPWWIGRHGPIEVLSDTKGFNLKPYVKEIVAKMRTTWITLAPNTVRAPLNEQGHVSIEFRLMKDGHIEDVKYHESSGNEGLDRAAYGAIMGSGPMPPLPAEFQCQFVELRFHFYYNQRPGETEERGPDDRVVPCVTGKVDAEEAQNKVTVTEKVPIVVSPSSSRLAPGAKTRFSAKIFGLVNSAVTWSVRGSGCEASTCGVISSEGLYTAPDKIPNPPAVRVIASSTVTPTNSASSMVTIAVPGDAH